ncbi:Protein of unknown function [[Bacillus] enclensis]|uniref:DUF3889 domain-containing protein n=2 Tax=Rossellomorea TaxID=2837508 RepID=A0A1C4BQ51_9BACI|nr:YqzG/YhdC family protein [[Bacillus] enclensis]SCC09026.1 Protein of unknown function [[Bacillus] enclensis]
MKKLRMCMFLIPLMTLGLHGTVCEAKYLESINVTIPSYAKWGRLAMKKTKERYPQAQIIDYLHIGREDSGGISTEKFKLWLKGKDKEFGVLVNIRFDTKTEQLKQISFSEVSR